MKIRYSFLAVLVVNSIMLQAQTIVSIGEEFQVTSSSTYDQGPKMGNDGISDLVVFSTQPYDPVNNYTLCGGDISGDIWYQRLVNGSPSGEPVQVSSPATHEEANDVWGDYIVYTAYENCGAPNGAIILYKISTATSYPLFSAETLYSCHIHNKWVVWQEGGSFAAQIMLYNVDWLGTGLTPLKIAGPIPPTFQVEIGDRFIVWTEFTGGQYDIVVRDLDDGTTFALTNTPLVDDAQPSTFGPWVVWSARAHGSESTSIIAMNADTWETRVIAENGASNFEPRISGDLIVWASTINGKLDVFAHQLSTSETFQVTNHPADQFNNDLLGDLLVYSDNRNMAADIYGMRLSFTVYIPDPNFEQALIDLGIDSDGTINQQISRSDAARATSLDISDPENNSSLPNVNAKIADLTGIEAFINLTELNCSNNLLTILNVTQNTALVKLFCDNNQLTGLDVSNNVDLELIWCQHNGLTSLDLSHNPVLEYLRMHNNLVSSLDLSQNTELYSLACGTNLFTSIDLTANTQIQYLACNNLQLSTLIVSHISKLRTLVCGDNNLTTINLSLNTELFELFCENNLLTELDLSNNQNLVGMKCNNNSLGYLNLKNRFNSILTSLDATNNELSCIDADDELADHSAWLVDPDVIFSNDCGYNTQQGESVILELVVSPTKTAITTYEKVVLSGETTIEVKTEDPDVPDGYKTLDPSEVFDIKTTAEYTGKIEVELDYSELTIEKEEALRMLHKEDEIWKDVTKSLDMVTKIIKGEVSTLSPFVIVEDIQPPAFEIIEDITVNNDPGEAGAIVSFIVPVATDNSSEVTTEQTDGTGLTSGSFYPIGITTLSFLAIDGAGNTATCGFNVVVNNPAPVIDEIVAPVDPIALGGSAVVEVFFTNDNLTEATINWGDGSEVVFGDIFTQPITWYYIYPAPGVYPISIKLVDVGGEITEEIYRYIVVYDPEGGFVTGGGWIFSPEGAYQPDPLLTGKASFGFVSKYKKDSSIPDGNTEFQFKAGDLNFNSYVYDWLVIAGSKAMFKGEGTINGTGNYGFMLTAIDADLTPSAVIDKFRIKIWDNNDFVVYDNNLEDDDNADPITEIGGGSIIIHTKNMFKSASVLDTEARVKIYPNPFDNSIYVDLFSESTHEIIIDMVDMNGRVIEYLYTGMVAAKVDHHFELNITLDLIPGYYMLRIRNVDGDYLGREMIQKQ